jgi:hypothetical protein
VGRRPASDFGFRVSASGFRLPGFVFRVSVFGFRFSVFYFRVSGFGFRVSDIRGGVSQQGGVRACLSRRDPLLPAPAHPPEETPPLNQGCVDTRGCPRPAVALHQRILSVTDRACTSPFIHLLLPAPAHPPAKLHRVTPPRFIIIMVYSQPNGRLDCEKLLPAPAHQPEETPPQSQSRLC